MCSCAFAVPEPACRGEGPKGSKCPGQERNRNNSWGERSRYRRHRVYKGRGGFLLVSYASPRSKGIGWWWWVYNLRREKSADRNKREQVEQHSIYQPIKIRKQLILIRHGSGSGANYDSLANKLVGHKTNVLQRMIIKASNNRAVVYGFWLATSMGLIVEKMDIETGKVWFCVWEECYCRLNSDYFASLNSIETYHYHCTYCWTDKWSDDLWRNHPNMPEVHRNWNRPWIPSPKASFQVLYLFSFILTELKLFR